MVNCDNEPIQHQFQPELSIKIKLTTSIDLNILSELSGISIDNINLMSNDNYVSTSLIPSLYTNQLYLSYYKYTYPKEIIDLLIKLDDDLNYVSSICYLVHLVDNIEVEPKKILLDMYKLMHLMTHIKLVRKPNDFIITIGGLDNGHYLFPNIRKVFNSIGFDIYDTYYD